MQGEGSDHVIPFLELGQLKAAPSGPSSARREGHLIGYARVSTTGQDTATQEAKLNAAGCTLIRTETVSGGSRNGRNELASILDFIALRMSSLWSSWTA